MNSRLFPLALRELRTDLTKRPTIIGMLALGTILGISGPFDTLRVLSMLPRMLYWISVVFLTFATGSLFSNLAHAALANRATWLKMLVSILSMGIAITLVLGLLNLLVFGIWPTTWTALLIQAGTVTLIAAVVEICSFALRAGSTAAPSAHAPLLARLKFENRGALIALSAEDHYVRVTTDKGTEMVLMRLSDAVKEVGDTEGLQIHRSHWIALGHITKVTRNGDRGEATLSDLTTRPISRGYMPAVRAAGLLPKAPDT